MSQAIEDMYAYTLLTDSVVQQILMSQDKRLEEVLICCCGLPMSSIYTQRDVLSSLILYYAGTKTP